MGDTIWASASRELVIGPDRPFCIIGECINPAGKPRLSSALSNADFSYVVDLARRQQAAGAMALDLNTAVPGEDESRLLGETVRHIQDALDLPLSIDSLNPGALGRGIELAGGRPLINSVTAQSGSLGLLDLAARRDCPLVALCLDDEGVSEDPARRFEIAKTILQRAADHGISAHDILFDPLVLPVARFPGSAVHTLSLLRRLTDELGVNTIIGASDISFGLEQRQPLTAHFLAMAISSGLTAAILNPMQAENIAAVAAAGRLMNRPLL